MDSNVSISRIPTGHVQPGPLYYLFTQNRVVHKEDTQSFMRAWDEGEIVDIMGDGNDIVTEWWDGTNNDKEDVWCPDPWELADVGRKIHTQLMDEQIRDNKGIIQEKERKRVIRFRR